MSVTKTKVETAVGQIFKTSGGLEEFYQVLYVDEQIVLLRSEDSGRNGNNGHRIERRGPFENKRDAGKFEYKPDSNLDMLSFDEQDWSEVAYIGEKTAATLLEAGYETNLDIQQADDGELTDVEGVGTQGALNLREYAK